MRPDHDDWEDMYRPMVLAAVGVDDEPDDSLPWDPHRTLYECQWAVERLHQPPISITMRYGPPPSTAAGYTRCWSAEASWGTGDRTTTAYGPRWGDALELLTVLLVEEERTK